MAILSAVPAGAAVIDLSGWTPTSLSGVFESPEFVRQSESLIITSLENTATFGYWQSPANIVNTEPGNLYRLTWSVAGDATPVVRMPSFRLRMHSDNLQQGDLLGGESTGDGVWLPVSTGGVYQQYVYPASSASLAALAFDLGSHPGVHGALVR